MAVVVLLPGMDGTGTLFDDFVAALGSKSITVSYPPDRALNYEQLESYVEAALPANEPYILLGESFSGPLAIRVASKKPPGLVAIVLVCTFARLHPNRAPGFLHALMAHTPFWKLPVAWGAAALLGRFNNSTIQSKLAAAIKNVKPAVWRTRLRAVLDVDVTEELQRVEVPILYLRATEDRVVPAKASTLIARTNERTRIVEIEGPHALLQMKAGECAKAIREFSDDLGIQLSD